MAALLGYVRDDSLYPLWWLIALRGLRWADVDLHDGLLCVVRQRITADYDVIERPPKSTAGRRVQAASFGLPWKLQD